MSTVHPIKPTSIDPAPLALGAFALTTFLLSWINAGFASPALIGTVVATAWFYGGIIQVLVGFWELKDGKLFPGVTFSSFGAFWISFALFNTLYVSHIPAASAGTANALFLAPWIVFTFYMLIGSFRTNVVLVIAFILVELVLVPAVLGFSGNNVAMFHLSGWSGLLLALDIWYLAASDILAHMYGRPVLPVGAFSAAA